MKLIEIKDKEILNNFLASQKHSQFLQSWEWGEFQNVVTGHCPVRTIRYGIEENGELIAVATLVKKNLGLGKSYWFCPRGPVVNFEFKILNFESIFNFLIFELNKTVENKGVIFLRFEPTFKIQNSKFKIQRTLDIQPSKTLILNLEKSEEELLKEMHQKTRYNIKLAEKKGIKIETSQPNLPLTTSFVRRGDKQGEGGEDFEEWWKIMEQTKDRDGFRLHEKDYYRKMLTSLSNLPLAPSLVRRGDEQGEGDNLIIKLIVAKYQNKIIAGNIVAFFGDMVTYVHGASSNEYRNLMAPYLLQWETIKMAKSLGYKYYDFYGIDEVKWPGVTKFKNGFSGEEVKYPGTFDAVFDKRWYWAYNLIRKIRRMF